MPAPRQPGPTLVVDLPSPGDGNGAPEVSVTVHFSDDYRAHVSALFTVRLNQEARLTLIRAALKQLLPES
jgi:hypothetical protein